MWLICAPYAVMNSRVWDIFNWWCAVGQSLEAKGLEVNSPEETRRDACSDSFLGRMEAQCDRIRGYRDQVLRQEGRSLSYDEAALEWIERYAEVFAKDHDRP
jgi:hypothetical protein